MFTRLRQSQLIDVNEMMDKVEDCAILKDKIDRLNDILEKSIQESRTDFHDAVKHNGKVYDWEYPNRLFPNDTLSMVADAIHYIPNDEIRHNIVADKELLRQYKERLEMENE